MNHNIFLKDNEVYKFCTKCKVDKVLQNNFYFRKIKNKIVPSAQCKDCKSIEGAIRRQSKEYRKRRNERAKQYYQNNKAYFKQYWTNNKDKRRKANKIYLLKKNLGGTPLKRGAGA